MLASRPLVAGGLPPLVLCLLLGPGCGLVLGSDDDDPGGDAGAGADASTGDGGPPGDSAPPDDDAGDGAECEAPADCEDALGPPRCGAWSCDTGACVLSCDCEDADLDGYGTGTECLGPDCDDGDDTVHDTGARDCWEGPTGTEGVGTCRSGSQTCTDGIWTACIGQVLPAGEACNDADDDCDGSTDEALPERRCGVGACARTPSSCRGGSLRSCPTPSPPSSFDGCDGIDEDCDGRTDEDCDTCVYVWGGASSATPRDPTDPTTPFRRIQDAIDWAADDASRPQRVCVASTSCFGPATYVGDVTMADGVSVHGGFEAGGWTYCGVGNTIIRPSSSAGVLFPAAVSSDTELSSFVVERASAPSAGSAAAITVDGATGARLSRIEVPDRSTGSWTHSYGVDVMGGGEVVVRESRIMAGRGTMEAIGVRSVGSRVELVDNCSHFAGGRCDQFCAHDRHLGIVGAVTFGSPVGESYAVRLDDSPGSVVERSATCGQVADVGAGVYVTGDAAGTVIRGSYVGGWGGVDESHGIRLEDCGGSSPWVVDNTEITAEGRASTIVDAIRAMGHCHPVVEGNQRILAGLEGRGIATGVRCGSTSAGTSACHVVGNLAITGPALGAPSRMTGIHCETGGCSRITGNFVDGSRGDRIEGLWLSGTGAFVDANRVRSGCPGSETVGIRVEDAHSRLQNNRVQAGGCDGLGSAYTGLLVSASTPGAEVDVHSNTIDAGGLGSCTSVGLDLQGLDAGLHLGSFRNNILLPGGCDTRYVVREMDIDSDPRLFDYNDLDEDGSAPDALYRDEGSTDLTDIADVNALGDVVTGSNLSVPAGFRDGAFHLGSGSMCVDAGTAEGAPATDMEGDPRDASPDVGADER